MKILWIVLLSSLTLFASVVTQNRKVSYVQNVSIADDIGFIDDITINNRAFDELPDEITFYPEDLQEGKVIISGILESLKKNISVDELYVEVSNDGGMNWHRVKGHSEWQWDFSPEFGKVYQLSLRVVRLQQKIKPVIPIEQQVYVASVTPSRVIKGSTVSLEIKGKNLSSQLRFGFASSKAEVLKQEFIDSTTVKLTLKVASDIDVDENALFYTSQEQTDALKSNGHIWFVDPPKIPDHLKLECDDEALTQEYVASIAIKPAYIIDSKITPSTSSTDQNGYTSKTEGYIAFLDDQTELRWEIPSSVYPAYFKVTFYTPDMKAIKSFSFKNSNKQRHGSLTLSPSQLYELYNKLPATLTKDSTDNPDKDKLLYYTDIYPGARFLFWKVEAGSYVSICKGIVPVKVAESEVYGLRMGAAPTGTVCDNRNTFLSSTKSEGSPGEAFYPGDTIELYGSFSLENSPWKPEHLVVDWGDGTYDVIALTNYDRDNALDCPEANSGSNYFDCKVDNTGHNQMITVKKNHQYIAAGRFKARVYVLPEKELGKAGTIAQRNYKEDMTALYQSAEKPYLYASAGNVQSDGSIPQKVSSLQSFSQASKLQSTSDRIFEVYCNPLDIYIVKDPDANGPLSITDVTIDHYSSEDNINLNTPTMTATTGVAIKQNYSKVNNYEKGLPSGGTTDQAKAVTVSACDTVLFARAKLSYHGQGYVRVTWLVDGVKFASKEYALGPTKNRDNLNYSDPTHWPPPIDEEMANNSPRLPLLDAGKHHVEVKVETIEDLTNSKNDYTLVNSGYLNLANVNHVKKQLLSDTSSYTVVNARKGEICYFDYPVEDGKFIKVFGLKNLQKSQNSYSGRGKVLIRLTNSKNGVGEYVVPVSFSGWKVDKEQRVTAGRLKTNVPVEIDDLPNMHITLNALSATVGKTLDAKMDIAISDKSLLVATTNKPIVWRSLQAPLAYNGDLYIKDQILPLTHIGWSLFNIASQSVAIDLSHQKGKGSWVGINLGKNTKLYPYTFHLANETAFNVQGWSITDQGLSGKLTMTQPFSHVLGDGRIGWKALDVKAKNHNLSALYTGFYVDMPWPKVRLNGGDIHLNYLAKSTKESDVTIQLQSGQQPKESYGNTELSIKKIKSFEKIGQEWGILTESHLAFFDREHTQNIGVDVSDMFFTMFSTTGFGKKNSDATSITLDNQTIDLGGSTLNVNNVLLKADQTHGKAQKLAATFAASLTLEKWSQSSSELKTNLMKQSANLVASDFEVSRFTPVTRSYPLGEPLNKSKVSNLKYLNKGVKSSKSAFIYLPDLAPFTPNSDIAKYPHIAGLNANISNDDCSAMESDTFSAHVDTHYFGSGPAIEATMRYGVVGGKSYWLMFTEADGLNIPLFAGVFLYKIRGGACYRFDPDNLVTGSGCNATPNPNYGLGLAFGAGVKIGSEDLVKIESTMIINTTEGKVGFYGIKGALLHEIEITQGKIEYVYGSHFQATLGATFDFPSGEPMLKLDATNGQDGKIDLKMGGDYYLHVGTQEQPITGTLVIFKGEMYFMAGTDIKGIEAGLSSYLGFSSVGNHPCTKADADCAAIGVETNLRFGLHYDPFSFLLHADEEYGANACIDFGKLGTRCVGLSASGYIDMGCCDPMKLAGGAELDFPSPVPNVGVDIGIIPVDFDIDIHW